MMKFIPTSIQTKSETSRINGRPKEIIRAGNDLVLSMFTHSRNGITNHGENDRLTVKGLKQEAYQFNPKRKESTGSSGNKAVDSASELNSVA